MIAFALFRFLGRGVARIASRIAAFRAGEAKASETPRHFVSVDHVASRRRTVSGACGPDVLRTSAGYLRDLTRRARAGEFGLGPMLMSLMRANASGERQSA